MLALTSVDAATSLSAQGISVAILVAGKPAEVFVPTKIENVHSGFIISTEGASFIVRVLDDRAELNQMLMYELFCDGEMVQRGTETLGPLQRKIDLTGKRTSSTSRSPYTFSKIKLSDDPLECTSNSAIINGVGSISLNVWRVVMVTRNPTNVPRTSWPTIFESDSPIIDEKLKKGMIPHTTKFGASTSTQTYLAQPTVPHRIDPAPWLIFTFNYRSREVLEFKSIVKEEAPVIPLLPAVVDVKPIDNKRSITLLDDSEGEETAQGRDLAKRVKQENIRVKAEKIGKVRNEREIIILSDSD